jgi:AraC-like DNA-binding protein
MASRYIDHGAGFGRSFVLDERARVHHAEVDSGALSIKCMARGAAWYTLEGTRFRLEGPRFLLLNHGQSYRIDIDSGEPVESFCVFFGAGVVEDALNVLTESDTALLDKPSGGKTVSVADRLYEFDDDLIPHLYELRDKLNCCANDGVANEAVRNLAEAVVRTQEPVRRQMARIPAVKAVTREEIYRRLHRARDFLDSSLADQTDLSGAAAAACLSPHHFHRLFRQNFHLTPHEYLTRRRLERASLLLRTTGMTVMEVCLESGFRSLPSFSTLFRRRFGVSPAHFRKIR